MKCHYAERLDCPYNDTPTSCSDCEIHKGLKGKKFDDDKPRWDLLPLEPIKELVQVLTFGAQKYAPNNWRKVDDGLNRYYSACLRHLVAYKSGELNDPETGLSHLAHAMCNLVFMHELQEQHTFDSLIDESKE
jgi:hypothetical protein